MKFLSVGDIFILTPGCHIYYRLPEHFAYENRQGVFDKLATTEIIVCGDKNGLNTDFLLGKYVVIDVDVSYSYEYPESARVTAQKIFEKKLGTIGQPNLIVEFDQSDSEHENNNNLRAIGKAKFSYEVIEETWGEK
mgnify:FL=1